MEVKILSKQIISFAFHFSQELKQVKAEVETKVQYGTPKKKDNSAIMLVEVDVHADNPEDFRIYMEEQIVFDFDPRPENYNEVLDDLFQTTGVAVVSDDLDNALKGIGKPPIRFKDHFNDTEDADRKTIN